MFLRIIIVIALIITVLFSWLITKNIIHPNMIFTLYWSFFIIVPLCIWKPNYIWKHDSLLWIMVTIWLINIGALVSRIFLMRRRKRRIQEIVIKQMVFPKIKSNSWKILQVGIILGIIGVSCNLYLQGFSLIDVTSVKGLLDVNAQIAYNRYYGDSVSKVIVPLFSTLWYACGLIGGYLINFTSKTKEKIWCIVALFPPLLNALFTNTKAGLIATFFLWGIGFIISYITIFKRVPEIKLKVIIILGSIVIMFSLLLFVIMLLRVGDFSANMRERISDKFMVYAFGQMVSFDAWFDGYEPSYLLGKSTYASFFSLLGMASKKQGVYDPIIYRYGNVFTVFRPLIEDYGKVGGWVYVFLKGIIMDFCFEKMLRCKTNDFIMGKAILAANLFWVLFGFTISAWVYTTFVLTFLIFLFFLLFAHGKICPFRKNK